MRNLSNYTLMQIYHTYKHNEYSPSDNLPRIMTSQKSFFFVFILCDLFLNSAYIVITQHRPFEVCNASVTYLHENINDESEI